MSDIWFVCKQTDKVVELSDCLECKEPKNCLSLASYQQGREDATKEMDLTSAYAKGRADERAKLLSVSQEQLTNALEILLSNEDGTDCIKDVISLLELVKTLQ